jgi:putative phosphoesterase
MQETEVKLGIISDTHVRTIDELPDVIRKALVDVDIIVHAGDFTHKTVLDGLKMMGEVKAVRGNMDSMELKEILPEKNIFEVNGRKIGLVHGSGAPSGIAERVRQQFSDTDVIIFGHSHEPCNGYIQGTLMLNPGRAGASFILLTIDDDVKARIIRI